MTKPNACIVSIGDELLAGECVNSNSTWLSGELTRFGVPCELVMIIPDDHERIVSIIRRYHPQFTYVFVTGGIGPTHDDVTRQAVAAAVRRPLAVNRFVMTWLKRVYPRPSDLIVYQMGLFPKGSRPIANSIGGAYGFKVSNIFVFPGVPDEMRYMFNQIKGSLKGKPSFQDELVSSKPESDLAGTFNQCVKAFPNVKLGSYPRVAKGHHIVKIVLKSNNQNQLGNAKRFLIRQGVLR